jgi:hypothetical protein
MLVACNTLSLSTHTLAVIFTRIDLVVPSGKKKTIEREPPFDLLQSIQESLGGVITAI